MTHDTPSATLEVPAAAKVRVFPDAPSCITMSCWPGREPAGRIIPVTAPAAVTRTIPVFAGTVIALVEASVWTTPVVWLDWNVPAVRFPFPSEKI